MKLYSNEQQNNHSNNIINNDNNKEDNEFGNKNTRFSHDEATL